MKHHWSIKMIALILVVVSACLLAVSGCCIFINWSYDLYDRNLRDVQEDMAQDTLTEFGYRAAYAAASQFLMEQNTQVNSAERQLWCNHISNYWQEESVWPMVECTISTSDGTLVATSKGTGTYTNTLTAVVDMNNGKIVNLGRTEEIDKGELPELDSRTMNYEVVDYGLNTYRVEHFPDVTYQVEIYLTAEDMEILREDVDGLYLVAASNEFRQYDIGTAIVSAIVLIASILYLCFSAGKAPGTAEIQPRGTNRIPLDLFLVAGCGIGSLPLILGIELLWDTERAASVEAVWLQMFGFGALIACTVLIATLFLMALCAQVRLGGGAWYKRTIIGRCWNRLWGWVKRLFGKASDKVKNAGVLKRLWLMVRSAYHNLPLIWQWVVLYGLLRVLNIWMAYVFRDARAIAVFFTGFVGFPIVVYTAYGFGKLRDAAKRMSEGDLNTKIDTNKEELHGQFEAFAQDLNALGDTCMEAAMEKMKSERMKSELITNVSHDIKTPLTSIINYVDLLQKAENEDQRKEYLEVLDRQSQRLKKLIEDLMEMSKASSGNIPVELSQTDVVEAVNQALGEFADRMAGLDLKLVFRQKDEVINANCDGKLLWRVMSNLLGNVVKYAQPGTRVYVDVVKNGNKVQLSVKNISRDPLNITAEELMERFVRGDESRNSEGNGLGLNIARSLMEVQGGDLSLTVDGDLFKVMLTLNGQ